MSNEMTIAINLIILGLNLKLYTEYFKDRSITKRKQSEVKDGA